jgi:hypothetical protein
MWRLRHCIRVTASSVLAAALQLSAAATFPALAEAEAAVKIPPAHVEPVVGTQLKRIKLSPNAARRLDLQTAEVREGPSGKKVVPYASVVYDLNGAAWVYTNPEPLTYVRHRVTVELISGHEAYVTDGPPAGTLIVIVGVAELYGTEKGVGH